MVAFSKIALVAAASGAAMASPAVNLGPSTLFSQLKAIPSNWEAQGAAPKSQLIRAQIGLKQQNMDKLQAKLMDISHPDSKNYGKWMSQSEINELVAPPKENIAAVKSWLHSHGITEIDTPSPDYIEFTVPVSKMEQLLNTKYTTYKHKKEGRSIPRTQRYEVPKELHNVIDMVTPTTAFYQKIASVETDHDIAARESINERATSCSTSRLTPACLKQLYNVDYTAKGNSPVGTTQYDYQAASHSDFALFTKNYSPGTADFKDVYVKGGVNQVSSGNTGEGNLDTQWSAALAAPNAAQFISVGPENSFSDEIANFASWLTTGSNVPASVSSSYGDVEDHFDSSYMTRVCNDFMKAGSAGISVFWSSGDSGIGGNQDDDCSDGFYANWPASCPWITSVGGTQFNSDGTETVALFPFSNGYDGSSGGGFSNQFSTPSYQSADVKSYQAALNGKFDGYYNAQGRGYPDISLVAINYVLYVGGKLVGEGGTSASAPAWAGMVSTLNDYRKSNGKSTLGFLNTLLYSKNGRTALRDVTQGNNHGCNQDGFPALKGWDAATGLGTLDFGKLRAML